MQASLTHELRRLEEELLAPDVRRSRRLSELLAEGFVEFGSSGRTLTKKQVIASLRREVPVKITVTVFRVSLLAPGVALVTYRACKHTEPPVHSLRSSIWQKTRGRWQAIFHQGRVLPSEP